jgi:hypothetical protein
MAASAVAYDFASVSRTLGLPVECNNRFSEPASGEVVVYYGGWTWRQLRTSRAGQMRLSQNVAYDVCGWRSDAGYYRLLLPVPGTNYKTRDQQLRHLACIDSVWQPAPICVVATAMLMHLTEHGKERMEGYRYRCAESLSGGCHVELANLFGRCEVTYGYGPSSGHVWLAASRKC